jgi:surface polysaccharide O-acyltransferase-like enzyme
VSGAQKPRELWPDLVRVYATVAVVLLHAASVAVSRFGRIDADAWLWADFYRSLTSTCIPLFVMLSGALLLNAPTWDARSFFRRRLAKVIVPLLVLSVVYALWSRYFHGQDLSL